MAKYIYYKNGKVYIKKNHPEELDKKLYYCRYLLEIDLNYYLTYLKLPIIGGERIGIKNRVRKSNALIMIIISNDNKISLFDQYNEILENDSLKYIIGNEI